MSNDVTSAPSRSEFVSGSSESSSMFVRGLGSREGRGQASAEGALVPLLSGLVSIGNKGETRSSFTDFNNRKRRGKRMTRGVVTTSRLIQDELTSRSIRFRAAMITLTYRPGCEWKPAHVKDLLAHYRKWFQRKHFDFRYVWVLELTKAGVPHYHILAWFPRGVKPPFPDKQGWWPHGSTQSAFARSPVGYMAKYAGKGLDGVQELPKGARLWGSGGCSESVRVQRTWAMAPAWVRNLTEGKFARVRKGNTKKDGDSWWQFLDAGFKCSSPWDYDASFGVVRWRGWTTWDVEFFPISVLCDVYNAVDKGA